MKLFVCLAAALSIVALTARAPSPSGPAGVESGFSRIASEFDVVSVKRNTSGGPILQRNTPGNLAMFNVPVRQLGIPAAVNARCNSKPQGPAS